MSDWTGLRIEASRPLSRSSWEWLRRALRDVGHPVSGSSLGGDRCSRFEITCRGSAREVEQAILDLWDLERPEGARLAISVQYD